VYAPYGQLDAGVFQCFSPRQNVLINAIQQRTIEVKQES
jgi:hypothetical protein